MASLLAGFVLIPSALAFAYNRLLNCDMPLQLPETSLKTREDVILGQNSYLHSKRTGLPRTSPLIECTAVETHSYPFIRTEN
ncbi:hypothetical protein TSMEX_010311 [Taenia solium]|eukprot:TsM_000255700 transcript=TsM_000255700 gene=TsM_000255700